MGARALIAVALAAAGCAGPVPSAEVVAVAPSPRAGCERVTVAVHNRGGRGEIALAIVLRGPRVALPVSRTAELAAGQDALVVVDVPAPPGAYTATVEAQYPH